MKLISRFMGWFLNINAIWGLMILAAFALCAVQHYAPTTTVIPAECVRAGPNAVTIGVVRKGELVGSFEFVVQAVSGELVLALEDQRRQPDRPWLISARAGASGYLLKWDCAGHGDYTLAVNGTTVRAGKLVNLESLSDAAIDWARDGFDLALKFVATFVLFLGLMKVGEDAGIVQLVARGFYPLIRFLFPNVPRDHPANGAIVMNWTTTLLGLGNAATPFGLKAMKELQSLNKNPDVATDAQVMLLGYNTAGLALIPTTLLAVRKAAGCSNPFEIIGTCMFAGFVATVVAVVMAKLLGKLPVFSVRAALAERDHRAALGTSPEHTGASEAREDQ